jgi:hypothetical protein
MFEALGHEEPLEVQPISDALLAVHADRII